MDYQVLHDKISYLIEANHTNPYRLSQDLCYSGNYLNGILNKRKDFKISLLFKLCDKLNTTPVEFFAEETPQPHSEAFKTLKDISGDLTEHDMDMLIEIAHRCAIYNQRNPKLKKNLK